MDLTIIKMVINTLNSIEVKGKENMAGLLGSIEALESFVRMTEAQKPAENQEAPKPAENQEAPNG